MLKALIFDVDGTLAETEELHRYAFNQVFQKEGLPWHWSQDDYRHLLRVTGGKERIRYYAENLFPTVRLGDAEIIRMHQHKTRIYQESMVTTPPVARPGVVRLIEEACDLDIKLALATTTSRKNADDLLEILLPARTAAAFEVRICGEDVAVKKPDPHVYDLALKSLGVGAKDAVAFEDSAAGLRSATAAGLKTIVTPALYTSHHDFSGAWCLCSDLGEADQPHQTVAGQISDRRMINCSEISSWL